jgi:chromosome segregation ATPase
MSNDEQRDQKEEDSSMVDALSSLGWIEEKEEEEGPPVSEEESLKKQLNLFIGQNKQLTEELINLKEENEGLKAVTDSFQREKEQTIQLTKENNDTIENLLQEAIQKEDVIKDLESKIDFLNETQVNDSDIGLSIQNKENEIEALKSQLEDKNQKISEFTNSNVEKAQVIQNQSLELERLNKIVADQTQKIQAVSSDIETLKSEQQNNKGMTDSLNEKENKIKELLEQIQYLENDTIHKSKFEKQQILLEKKDEIITEKEKYIFDLEIIQQTANQSIKDFQQKVETFSLVKKDVENKEKRIKNLVLEIEKLTQKNITNEEFINQIQARLEESQEKSGNITGKFELEIMNLRNTVDEQLAEIKDIRESEKELKNKLRESDQIEDRILTEMQKVKDEKIKLESTLEHKEKELIELKKRIKVMRRDIKKS